MNAEILLKAGAILLPDAKLPKDILSDDVVARQWTHPGLHDPIVRLPTQNMLKGVDLEMELLGFESPQDQGVVGKQRRKKLGFPGWALVHDAKNARFALDVVNDLKKAARKIKSKPGTGKEMIDEIGSRLATSVPHFLPSFYEEAAHAFLAHENYSYASQYFEKARDAERVYALEVDPELREQTFVDFALARALSIKSLTNFGQEMIDKGEAEEGFHSYFRIAVRRTRGGLPPSPAMAKDLKKLAKAAGLDPNEQERRFLKELFGAAALRMAAAGFWKAYKKSLIALAKEDPAARSEMLDLFPNMHPRNWFEILDMCDACDALFDDSVEAAAKSKHTTADWFSQLLKQQNRSGWRGREDIAERTFTLLQECGPRLKEDGLPIPLPEGWYGANPDFVEAALAEGATFTLPEDVGFVRLYDIASYKDNEGRCRDWVHISKHEKFRKLAIESVEDSDYYMDSWVELLPERPAMKEVVGAWLAAKVEKTSTGGGLVSSYEILSKFAGYSKLLWALYPESAEKLMATDIAAPLQNTLQIGVLDEYGWPAWDELREKFPNRDELKASYNFPHLVVWDKVNIRVIGPEGITVDAELPSHKGYELNDAVFTQGSVLLVYRKSWEDYGQWLGNDKLFDMEDSVGYRNTCVALSDGRSMFSGCRVFTPGDTKFPYDYEKACGVVTDGKTYWKKPDDYGSKITYTEYDPLTGKKSGESNPPFLVDGETAYRGTLRHAPGASATSPIAVKDDVYGLRWTRDQEDPWHYHYEDINGRKYDGNQNFDHIFMFPGDDTPRYYNTSWRDFEIMNADGVVAANSNKGFRNGGFPNIESLFLTYFEARDAKGSKALRSVTRETCTALIEAGRVAEGVDGEAAIIEKLKTAIPEITHDDLRKGVAGVVMMAFKQREMLDNLNKMLAETPVAQLTGYEKDPDNMLHVLNGFFYNSTNKHVILAQIKDVAEYFTREGAKDGDGGKTPDGTALWESFIGYSGAIAYQAISPDRTGFTEPKKSNDELRETLQKLLFALADSPLAGVDLDKKIRWFDLERKYADEEEDEEILPGFRNGIESGVTMTTYQGNEFFTWGEWSQFSGLEFARSGKFSDVVPTSTHELGPGWGTRGQLEELLALFDKNGAIPLADTLPAFMEATGLSEPEAALAVSQWGKDIGVVKMKAAEFNWATDVFKAQSRTAYQFFTDVISSGPAEDLWDAAKLSDRLTTAWLKGCKKLPTIDPEFVTGFKKTHKYANSFTLREIADVSLAVDLTKDKKWAWWSDEDSASYQCEGEGYSDPEAYVTAADYAMYNARVGTPVYSGIGSVFENIKARIQNEDFLFEVSSFWDTEKDDVKELMSMVKGKPKGIKGDKVHGKDGVFYAHSRWSVDFFANWKAITEGHPVVEKLAVNDLGSEARDAHFFFGDTAAAIISRTKNSPVAEGEFEANPIASVPKLVAEVAKEYGISEDAAGLYLQLASLPFPSDANVRAWNNWKKKQHDNAIAELLDKELVVQAKRSRASRTVFVPGHWEPKQWDKPIESWKFKLYNWVDDDGEWRWDRPFSDCILIPPHQLFEAVWKRIKSGDGPGFEDPPK